MMVNTPITTLPTTLANHHAQPHSNQSPRPTTHPITAECLADTNSWIDEMSTYLRQKDPNHLITVGNEGFFGPDSPFRADNPFGTPSNVNPGSYYF